MHLRHTSGRALRPLTKLALAALVAVCATLALPQQALAWEVDGPTGTGELPGRPLEPVCVEVEPFAVGSRTAFAGSLSAGVILPVSSLLLADTPHCLEDYANVASKDPKDGKVVFTITINKDLDKAGICTIESVEVVKPQGVKPGKDNSVEIPYDPKVAKTEAEIRFNIRCKSGLKGVQDVVMGRVYYVTITPDPKGDKVEAKGRIVAPW